MEWMSRGGWPGLVAGGTGCVTGGGASRLRVREQAVSNALRRSTTLSRRIKAEAPGPVRFQAAVRPEEAMPQVISRQQVAVPVPALRPQVTLPSPLPILVQRQAQPRARSPAPPALSSAE